MSQNPELAGIRVDLEFTPNPNTLKYVCEVALIPMGAEYYTSKAAAEGKSPLALKLFAVGDIAQVMVGKNFVTVTLEDQEKLTEINDQIIETIKKHLVSGEPAVFPEALEKEEVPEGERTSAELQIIKILDEEIRPAVAMDGGDITFERFEDGIVFLQMKGACSGCPSSTATLKMGIENRLKDSIPEVIEVVSV